MESFDVWIRTRAAAKPHIYGPVLASEGREILEAQEAPKEPVVVAPAVLPAAPAQPARDLKAEVADHDDAEVAEDMDFDRGEDS